MQAKTRRIGPIGTSTRLVAAAGLLYLALFDGTSWGLEWYDAALGLAVLPAAVIAFGLAARSYASGPVRFTGSAGTTVNCVLIVALAVNPLHRRRGRALLRSDAHRRRLARPARLRGDRALELDPRPRRPARLPRILADRPRRDAPRHATAARSRRAATRDVVGR
jgi:hypothetical protein